MFLSVKTEKKRKLGVFMSNKMEKKAKRSIMAILLLLAIGLVIGLCISYGVGVMVQKTADAKFCTVCHTMQPMADSYHADVHGGKNSFGVKASCVDCHLPHDSLSSYLFEKAKTGLHDFRVQTFSDVSKIDWQAKRKKAKNFVYDSGCLRCHTNLKDATMSNPKGFIAHKEYFEKRTDKKCVECHENVGHHILGDYIKK